MVAHVSPEKVTLPVRTRQRWPHLSNRCHREHGAHTFHHTSWGSCASGPLVRHPAVTQHLLLDDMKGTNHCAAGTAKALSTAEGPSRPPWATQLTWGEAALGCLLSNALPSYSSFWKTMLPNPVSQRWPHPPKVNEALLPAVTLPWLLRHELVI